MDPNRFDASAVNEFRACPERYRCKYELHLRPDYGKGAPEAGSAIHAGLDEWFTDKGLTAAQQACAAAWGEDPSFLQDAKPKFTGGFLQAILAGYADAWPRDQDPWNVTASEDYIEHDFDIFVWCGLRDRVCEDEAGGRYIIDTKGSSLRLDDARKQTFGLSTQFMGYQAMEEAQGRQVDGVIVDYIQWDTRYHKVKPEHFQRITVRFNQEQLDQWQEAALHTVEEIQKLRQERGIDRRWPQHDHRCFDYFRPCPYLERCQVGEAEAEYVGNYRTEVWDPKTVREK